MAKKVSEIDLEKQNNELEKAVAEIINDHINEDETYTLADYLQDLFTGGCQSGFVMELLYYTDTEKFYATHKSDISELLASELDSHGLGISDMFGDKWDRDDPLAFEQANQNMLAWYAFEQTARNIGAELNIHI